MHASIDTIPSKSTGDPFIDLGDLVLQSLKKRFPDKTDLEFIQYVINVYIQKWNQKLHSVFFTNSKILNPSTKGKHESNTFNYYNAIIEGRHIDGCLDDGYCKTCGKKGLLYQNSREFFPNSGSGAFVNFHHSHEPGIFLCNECSLKLFFVPLGVIVVGGKNGFLHTQSEKVKQYWQQTIIDENLDKIVRNTSEGILRTKYSNPQNALFKFAGDIIQKFENNEQSEYLQLITFTNFGAAPDGEFFILPNPVFKFLSKVLSYYPSGWYTFVRRFYRIRETEWDIQNQQWIKRKKKETQLLSIEEYLNNPNEIYQRLLNNRSILGQLRYTQKNHYLHKLNKFPIEITIYYIKEVLKMTKEQVGIIARIADIIFELSRKENNYKKYLFLLESAGKAHQLRTALLKLIKANFHSGAKEPLIRMSDYVDYLFPDGQYWGEIRDVLLIHLYEKYHDEGINRDEIPESEVEETQESQPVDKM